ncbi:MAG: alpha/beta hydrolase [Gammaproteobacteria bacterium]|nr:alpha/beta hydrolase [Gammaproteobacteria bacterium]
MITVNLFYATNRRHIGDNRWTPTAYSTDFSSDGQENLRFGQISFDADETKINQHLQRKKTGEKDAGDGEKLAEYFARCIKKSSTIKAYAEKISYKSTDKHQEDAKFGSQSLFEDLRETMLNKSDVLVYIHGFNVSWTDAVATASSLQLMLNRHNQADDKTVQVILFTWPSDGKALPYVSYKSDRTEASGSGKAFGRGLLKLRDYLEKLKSDSKEKDKKLCDQDIHLLCHSMGNYVLQNTLARMRNFSNGRSLPRLFQHVFMCAPDVNDDILEPDKAMGDLHEITRNVTVYHNNGDLAMAVSDYTKGNPDRLGHEGAARPAQLHRKCHQVDCSPLVSGLVEHSYYMWGPVNNDITFSIEGVAQDDTTHRRRNRHANYNNVWVLE